LDLAQLEDADVVALACQGQERAFRALVKRYQRPVFSLIVRMVHDTTLAEDLAQETFVKAFRALGTYDRRYRFSNWLFKIANNLTIDQLRKRQIPTLSIDRGAAGDAEGAYGRETPLSQVIPDSGETPENHVENLELGGQLEHAIGQLRPEYRSAVLLRHVEGYAYEEIADIMGVPIGTVKTYLHRGRSELRDRLEAVRA
jgi:RNA polymerase sigma-70 factor, ECF subfamily